VAVKIALVQLPLQSHDYVYSLENIPLAASHLAASLAARKAPAEGVVCSGAVKSSSPLHGGFLTGRGSFFEEHGSGKRVYVPGALPRRGCKFLDDY
jgi:hypothetical protein